MADNLPVNFPIPQEQLLINYAFTDIASGTGYESFSLYQSTDSTGTTYLMGANSIYSSSKTLNLIIDGTEATGDLTTDFYTSEFKYVRKVKGKAIINIPYTFEASGASGTAYLRAKLFVYDGTTSTQIGDTMTSNTLTDSSASIEDGKVGFFCLETELDVTVRKGEQIRIEIYQYTAGSETCSFHIGTDPANRSTVTNIVKAMEGTNSVIYIPFDIQQ